ncbi:MAG: DNA repair exonuclease [Ignavibacteriaceae bacterium]|nr:DNA repair exonuclease [Ignavibacteriaceae bacterium]
MELKIIHTADWHLDYDPVRLAKAENSLKQLVEYCKKETVNGIIIAGDIWDRLQPFGGRSAVSLCFDYLSQLSSLVGFIFIDAGNSSHDPDGSVVKLNNYRPNIWAFEYNVALLVDLKGYSYIDLCQQPDLGQADSPSLLIYGFPYPTKARLMGQGSIDENNVNLVEQFEKLLGYYGMISDRHPDTPKITVYHGNVAGSKLSKGQTIAGQEIIIPPNLLELTGANYYALGHIHMPQQIKWNMSYSGSLYNKDFGETEQKYFNSVKITCGVLDGEGRETFPMEIERIAFVSSRPMLTIEAEFRGGKFIYENHIPANAEVKFRYSVAENERELVTADILKELRKSFNEDVKIEANVIPIQREARSINMAKCKTLQDEIVEYGKVIKNEATRGILEKAQFLLENYNAE